MTQVWLTLILVLGGGCYYLFDQNQTLIGNNVKLEFAIEKDSYLEIFKKHNLDLLAIKKPGLIELRINNGTKKVFEEIENDSKNISVTATANDDS